MTLQKKDREKTWGFQESSVGIKRDQGFVLSLIWQGKKESQSPLLSLIKSCAASGIRKRQQCPELHPERKTHSRPNKGIYNTHSWVVTLLKPFLLAQWPDYCLFLFEGWVTSTHCLSADHKSASHAINSPVPVTHWTSLESFRSYWQAEDKRYKGIGASCLMAVEEKVTWEFFLEMDFGRAGTRHTNKMLTSK